MVVRRPSVGAPVIDRVDDTTNERGIARCQALIGARRRDTPDLGGRGPRMTTAVVKRES
jgi:hypothetical protein